MQIARFTIGPARALAGRRLSALYRRFVRRSVDFHLLIGRSFGLDCQDRFTETVTPSSLPAFE
jgi:hypothetical protein